ncbi:uncharacterized protein LOC115413085 [Sphaeramia orbicularis]|uniref:uncharacterized protein LOC115413085 n=1 Tax=Sphaeramia orbicularis TaxID=375764 RepID=UPI00117D3C2A|nr:uncharacterized protein LOC115413085 [Sphaeramia orbicularis]
MEELTFLLMMHEESMTKSSEQWGHVDHNLLQIQDEFHRITMVHLEPKFKSKLDECTPRLLNLFHSKGRSMGLRLQAILLKTPSNPDINMTRDVVIRCLMMYLGESTDQLLKEYDDADEDSVSQDLAVQNLKIYNIKANTSEDPDNIGIVMEGVKVLTALGNFPRACSLLIGLVYAVNLAYPKELRYTFEVFQKLLLGPDSSKLSPKIDQERKVMEKRKKQKHKERVQRTKEEETQQLEMKEEEERECN